MTEIESGDIDLLLILRRAETIGDRLSGQAADEIEQLREEVNQLKAQQKELITNRKIYEG